MVRTDDILQSKHVIRVYTNKVANSTNTEYSVLLEQNLIKQ